MTYDHAFIQRNMLPKQELNIPPEGCKESSADDAIKTFKNNHPHLTRGLIISDQQPSLYML